MNIMSTLDKLHAMKLREMADIYRMQNDDEQSLSLDFDTRFAMLVDAEYSSRLHSRQYRLKKNARLEQPMARIENIEYTNGRKLDRQLIEKLSSCEYIGKHLNIFITGATGCGKTYLANVFGNCACEAFIRTRYIRVPDLLAEINLAARENREMKVIESYVKPELLILDEWLLMKPKEDECRYLFEIIHKRCEKKSTIFCSQYRQDEWFERLDDSPLAESLLDRIIHFAYRINIEAVSPEKDISMREYYGLRDKA